MRVRVQRMFTFRSGEFALFRTGFVLQQVCRVKAFAASGSSNRWCDNSETLATDIFAATQFLTLRDFMNNWANASAVAYDCLGGVLGGELSKDSLEHCNNA